MLLAGDRLKHEQSTYVLAFNASNAQDYSYHFLLPSSLGTGLILSSPEMFPVHLISYNHVRPNHALYQNSPSFPSPGFPHSALCTSDGASSGFWILLLD